MRDEYDDELEHLLKLFRNLSNVFSNQPEEPAEEPKEVKVPERFTSLKAKFDADRGENGK